MKPKEIGRMGIAMVLIALSVVLACKRIGGPAGHESHYW
ncbi:hypothetical protein SAMN06265361_11142 [Laceyella tengchongensis]|uniref:Lipoprotein n=1 Tax=Laceyella tengchongensis TaxID=574699 RepID=A0AA45WS80_9BACL|nr:hypothetical protein SAMN06265361_11142 [Laceyella tengchongensis]